MSRAQTPGGNGVGSQPNSAPSWVRVRVRVRVRARDRVS